MIFMIFVIAFVTCACVLVPLATFGICAANDRKRSRRGRRAGAEGHSSALVPNS
jgi:hypothetical protein